MKITYTQSRRHRNDLVSVSVRIEDDVKPRQYGKFWYQPTELVMTWHRQMKNGALTLQGRDRDQEWDMSTKIIGRRVLKSGAIGTQPVPLWWADANELPWVIEAEKMAREAIEKTIADWPDPTWL
jgi:hypothetical protein